MVSVMQCNAAMKRYLDQIDLEGIPRVPAPPGNFRITQRLNIKGEPYWCVGAFWHVDVRPEERCGKALTDLEWEGNECTIETARPDYDIVPAVRQSLVVLHRWRQTLGNRFPTKVFDLFLHIDEARQDFQIANRIRPSVTVRFTAVRGRYHYADLVSDGRLRADIDQPFLYIPCTPHF